MMRMTFHLSVFIKKYEIKRDENVLSLYKRKYQYINFHKYFQYNIIILL